jgi:lysyl-tRNA synthetase, class I
VRFGVIRSFSNRFQPPHPLETAWKQVAPTAKAWPFDEALKLANRYAARKPDKEHVLFETGYGPSGLPHIGTFGEVVRTSMVRHAFSYLSDLPTRLVCFSDDMDGLRKVPDNVPQQEMLARHLGKPLTQIPDPFETHESFGHHNNARLKAFLDTFGFEYDFMSSTDCYQSGLFDPTLRQVLAKQDAIVALIRPTLGPERRETYSPFLPLCPRTGRVLQVKIDQYRIADGTVVYTDPETGKPVEVPVTGGACKLQWKADWGMRWAALGVDYEMSGKDLIDSVKLSSQICQLLEETPPEGFSYELFLDQQGQKISKSKGNGLSAEEWLTYAPGESLAYFMYQAPQRAKRLYFDSIPRQVDDYLALCEKIEAQPPQAQLENPAWHIHQGHVPQESLPVSFSMLLNLASVCHTQDKAVLWGYITRYAPHACPETMPFLDALVGFALRYYQDFVAPHKQYRAPTPMERAALVDLQQTLAKLSAEADAAHIQQEVFEIGKRHAFPDLKAWFQSLYQILLGQAEGPRMGSFIALYGVDKTIRLIHERLEEKASGA